MKELLSTIIAAKGTKVAAFTMACLVALTGGGASGYYIYGATSSHVEPAEILIEETNVEAVAIPEEFFEEEEEPEAVTNKIYLVSTSVEKDLKISVVNDVGVTVTGYPFEVYVSKYDEKKDAAFLAEVARQDALKADGSDDEIDEESSMALEGDKYVDDDEDGIIAIEGIAGGEYKVVLAPAEGYMVSGAIQVAEVKEKVEYKVVDVKNQIKKESQINASIEDTSRKNVADEGGVPDVSALLNVPQDNSKDKASEEKNVTKVTKDDISSDVKKAAAPTVSVSDGKSVKLTKTTRTWVANPAPEETQKNEENSNPAGGEESPAPAEAAPTEATPTQSSRVKPLNLFRVGATTETKDEDDGVATYTYSEAEVSLSGNLTLYTNSTEKGSNTSALALSIKDEDRIINQSDITWSVADSGVATVSGSGNSVTVTAKKAGKTTVKAIVPYDDGTTTQTAEFICNVEVKEVDLSVPLTDKDGNKLYLDKECTKQATLADLNTTDKFYKEEKTEDKPSSEVSVKSGSVGVDVSKWNGSINWKQVAASGVSFAIIRCGYRGSATGALVQDPTFATNIKGAKAAGLKVGLYFFTQAVNEAEAVEEASMAVQMAKSYGINMPIYIDTEAAGGRADGLSKSNRTACIKAFCKTVGSAGYAPGVYASKCWYYDNLNAGELSGYNIWVAQYAAACNYSGRYNMWQYTSKGSVPGISGSVDMDIYY
ncbi:MAG: Ig-like domain-containing protein [Lachnospiraceae bacterium]|nr:Ig-like domain-containing protein [Lachnospiraceae bacterium]